MYSSAKESNAIEGFRPKILRYLARLVGPEDAEDVAQEVMLKVSRAIESFQGGSTLSTWIYRIATNTALDLLRTANRKQDLVPESELIAEDKSAWTGGRVLSVDRQLIDKEMDSCIRTVIDSLPLNYRSVLTLGELEGLKDREVADILGISTQNVKIRLHRARARLKRALENGCSFYRTPENQIACEPGPSNHSLE